MSEKITIEEVKRWLRGEPMPFEYARKVSDLALSQHEVIEMLKRERDEAYERAAQVCEDEKNGCIDRFECADDIRALKDKP